MLRVFIADDSPLVRERLAELISVVGDVELVGQAENARGTSQAIQRLRPDVAILDIRMAGSDGLRVLETIKTSESPLAGRIPFIAVALLAGFTAQEFMERCKEVAKTLFSQNDQSQKQKD